MGDGRSEHVVPAVSVVVPLHQAETHLAAVLPPLRRALDAGELVEVLVVDDGSTDRGPDLCRAAGLAVLTTGANRGPAAARNVGARAARGDVLLFVDADVVLHDDAVAVVREVLADGAPYVAVFGRYDHAPTARDPVSVYKNLLHAHVHARAAGEATTFWAGCGAVRRDAFLAAGGFDERRFPRPSIEDVELGYRLREAGGRILLDPRLLGTHRKRWTLRTLLATDVLRRALPWARLIVARGRLASELNVAVAERWRALLALALLASLFAAPFRIEALAVALVLAVAAWFANRDLFSLVRRRAGARHALAAFLLHQAYYVYSAATYVFCVVERRLGLAGPPVTGRPTPTAPPGSARAPHG